MYTEEDLQQVETVLRSKRDAPLDLEEDEAEEGPRGAMEGRAAHAFGSDFTRRDRFARMRRNSVSMENYHNDYCKFLPLFLFRSIAHNYIQYGQEQLRLVHLHRSLS